MLLACLIVGGQGLLVAREETPEGGGEEGGVPVERKEGKEMCGLAPNYAKPLHKCKYQWRPVKLYLFSCLIYRCLIVH